MPINFELTFTQPLLAQLDTGQPRGSKDMARFITNNYVRTVLTGIPGGGSVPPVLPAPGLSTPAGPPPFPIPSVPINNYNTRARAMQRILQTYFEAREVLIMQGDIKSTIRSVNLLVRKAQTIRLQINQLLRQAADIQRQIQELPELFANVVSALRDIIDSEKEKISILFRGLDKFRLSLSTVEFNQRFSNEIRLINTIKNFKVTLRPDDYRVLEQVLTDVEYRISSLPDAQDGSEEEIFKRFISRQIQSSLKVIVTLSNAIVNPDLYIDYIKNIASVDRKLAPVLEILYRYKFIKRKLQPLIIKLRRKIDELIQRLRQKVEVRVQEEKLKLKKKLRALAAKESGTGKKSIYANAGKIISDFKKKYLKKIKNIRTTVRDVQVIVKTTQGLILRASQFKAELEAIVSADIQDYVDSFVGGAVTSLQPINSRAAVQRELNIIFAQNGLTNPIIRKIISDQIVGRIVSPTILLDYIQSSSNGIVRIFETFIELLNGVNLLDYRVRKLLQKRSTTSSPSELINTPSDRATVADVLIGAIRHIQLALAKIQQKLVEFINKQTRKLEETVQRITNDVKLKLIMLVPIKSDLKDGKTKVEIIKAKKDKIKHTKNQIQRVLRFYKITTTQIIPGATELSNNISRAEWRYSRNERALTKLIDGIFEARKLNSANSEQTQLIEAAKRKTKTDLSDYYFGLELLIDLFRKYSTEAANPDYISEAGRQLKLGTVGAVSQGYVDFYEKLKRLKNLRTANIPQIINFFADRQSFRVLESTYLKTVLTDIEYRYMRDTTAFLDQFSTNPLLARLFPNMKPGIDNILIFIIIGISQLISKIKSFVTKVYSSTVEPLIKKMVKKREKINEDIKAWLKEHVVKRAVNLDLKLMTIAFNLATRAFWTGFSWITPNGVRYTSIAIVPFRPMISKPDEGASRLVRELALNLQTQLTTMNGLVSPPPVTGIPPFPFIGYI